MLEDMPETKRNILQRREHDASLFRANPLVTKITGNQTADSVRGKPGKIIAAGGKRLAGVSGNGFGRSDTDSLLRESGWREIVLDGDMAKF